MAASAGEMADRATSVRVEGGRRQLGHPLADRVDLGWSTGAGLGGRQLLVRVGAEAVAEVLHHVGLNKQGARTRSRGDVNG